MDNLWRELIVALLDFCTIILPGIKGGAEMHLLLDYTYLYFKINQSLASLINFPVASKRISLPFVPIS